MRRTKSVCAAWLLLLLVGCAYHYIDDPTPDVDPVVEGGLRVMFIREQQSPGTDGLGHIWNSVKIREYLDRKCEKYDGLPERRFVDDDTDMSREKSPVMRELFARPRSSLPWLIITNGKTGYEGPVPEDVDRTLERLKQYGGA